MGRLVDEQSLRIETNVTVQVNGQEKINAIVDTLDRISSGNDLNKYLKSTEELIRDVKDGAGRVVNSLGTRYFNTDDAQGFVKSFNSLSAIMSVMGASIEDTLDEYGKIKSLVRDVTMELQEQGMALNSAFSITSFKDAYVALGEIANRSGDASEALRAMGATSIIRKLTAEIESYKVKLEEAYQIIAELQFPIKDFVGSDVSLLNDRTEDLERQFHSTCR